MDRSDAPASLLCFENLELDPERMLDNPVETGLGAGTVLVALVDPSEDHLVESSELVSHVLLDLVIFVTASGLDGELPAGALVLVPAVVRTVTASQELLVRVEIDPGLWQSHGGVLHVLWEVTVDRIDTGDWHVLLPVTDILYSTHFSDGLELIHHIDQAIKVEEVNLQTGLCNPGKGKLYNLSAPELMLQLT